MRRISLRAEAPAKPAARPLHKIGQEIASDWANPYHGAVPYIRALQRLNSVRETYGQDSAESIVRYFLVNAVTWRGPVARRVKEELRGMVGGHY